MSRPYDVPAYRTPIYQTAGQMQRLPPQYVPGLSPVSGFGGGDATGTGGGFFSTLFKVAIVVGVVYIFRKPIGEAIAGFDPQGELPGRAARATGRATGRAARAIRRKYDERRSR